MILDVKTYTQVITTKEVVPQLHRVQNVSITKGSYHLKVMKHVEASMDPISI